MIYTYLEKGNLFVYVDIRFIDINDESIKYEISGMSNQRFSIVPIMLGDILTRVIDTTAELYFVFFFVCFCCKNINSYGFNAYIIILCVWNEFG